MSNEPKAFISHATADQTTYAEPLARRLRERSIAAWYSPWEISGGDSLVQKIFEDGLKQAAVFIVILSKVSVERPWVKAEVDVAKVRNIAESIILIPVKVDDCEIPESLKATAYLSLEHFGTIEKIADNIADTILGRLKAPHLGKLPVHVERTSIDLPGLRPIDARVTELAYDVAYEKDSAFVYVSDLMQKATDEGMSKDQVIESMDALFDSYWFKEYSSRKSGVVILPPSTILPIASSKGHISDHLQLEVAATIYSEIQGDKQLECDELVSRFGVPKIFIDAILESLHDQGYFSWSQPMGGTLGTVFIPTTSFKRWLEDQA